jgi:hypothetical protein
LIDYTTNMFYHMNRFLNHNFDGLQTKESWINFYAHLVRLLVKDFNLTAGKQCDHIDATTILLPFGCREANGRRRDLFALTRLLFQAIVMIRYAVADGQHRLLSLSSVLLGFEIRDSLSKDPPIYFLKQKKCEVLNFKSVLGSCSVRLVYSYLYQKNKIHKKNKILLFEHKFEKSGLHYSRQRDASQSAKQARTLCDV